MNESVERIRRAHFAEAYRRTSMAAQALDAWVPRVPQARQELLYALAELDAAERVQDPEEPT